MDIPVIDFEAYGLHRSKPDEDKLQQLVSDVDRAFSTNGIAYIVNHGISKEQITSILNISKEFFSLPLESKEKYAMKGDEFYGYQGYETESLNPTGREMPDNKECYNYHPVMEKEMIFTKEIPESATAILSYSMLLKKIYLRLLEITTLALDINGDNLMKVSERLTRETFEMNQSALRFAYYPARNPKVDSKKEQLRFGEHTDYGCYSFITSNDVSGLEFQATSGEWIPVAPNSDALIVLAANCIQRMTSDRYRAVPHRGVFVDGKDSYKDRYSIIYFGQPDDDAVIKCLDGSNKYEPLTFLGYLKTLFKEKFKKY
ncbi:uncharacterized protein LOC144445261 [Glandiceps talaboti]